MVRRQQAADRATRPKLRSPGHPKFQRHVTTAFWIEIAKGALPEEALPVAEVAPAVGARWFRHADRMPPFDIHKQPSGRYLRFAEREEIALLRAQGKRVCAIARMVGRDPGTISRESRRNAATRGGKIEHRASVAQTKADMAARQARGEEAAIYLRRRAAGRSSMSPDGTIVEGPAAPKWTGLNTPRR